MILTEYDREEHLKCVWEEGYEEGYEEGWKIGIAEERIEWNAKCLIKLLSSRHQLTDELRFEIMEQKDAELLDRWFDYALVSDSLEEFLRKIGKKE